MAGFAIQHRKAAQAEFLAQAPGDVQQSLLALGFLTHDIQSRGYGCHRGGRQAGRKYERPRRVLQVIDHFLGGCHEAANRMAQYNQDVNGVPISDYWSAKNDPQTKASALSYIPEIPWNDGCTSELIYSDPIFALGSYTQSYGTSGFCHSKLGKELRYSVSGSGGPSTCFTGVPSIPGVVSGTCQGNPKPSWQAGVPGIPNDGERDQPDLALFSADGVWGSFLVECMSDKNEGGAPCTATNDGLLQGGAQLSPAHHPHARFRRPLARRRHHP